MNSFTCLILGLIFGGIIGLLTAAVLNANKNGTYEEIINDLHRENAELSYRLEQLDKGGEDE